MKFKVGLVSLLMICTAFSQLPQTRDIVKDNFDFAARQLEYAFMQIDSVKVMIAEKSPLVSPRTIEDDGSFKMVVASDWTSGFFPGELWYMYEYTQDDYWKKKAQDFTAAIESQKTNRFRRIRLLTAKAGESSTGMPSPGCCL